jgi:hypothetical protein
MYSESEAERRLCIMGESNDTVLRRYNARSAVRSLLAPAERSAARPASTAGTHESRSSAMRHACAHTRGSERGHAPRDLALVARVLREARKQRRARPARRRRLLARDPVVHVPVVLVEQLRGAASASVRKRRKREETSRYERRKRQIRKSAGAEEGLGAEERRNRLTLSNSRSSPSSIFRISSLANVLMSRSLSSVPRLRVWYTSRARSVSTLSPARERGVGNGSAGSARSSSGSCGAAPGASDWPAGATCEDVKGSGYGSSASGGGRAARGAALAESARAGARARAGRRARARRRACMVRGMCARGRGRGMLSKVVGGARAMTLRATLARG